MCSELPAEIFVVLVGRKAALCTPFSSPATLWRRTCSHRAHQPPMAPQAMTLTPTKMMLWFYDIPVSPESKDLHRSSSKTGYQDPCWLWQVERSCKSNTSSGELPCVQETHRAVDPPKSTLRKSPHLGKLRKGCNLQTNPRHPLYFQAHGSPKTLLPCNFFPDGIP